MTGEQVLADAERLLAERELSSALAALDNAERLGADPDRCAGGRWLVHMLRGDYERAWQESDAIQSRTPADPQRFWRGEDITGKRVMLRCLHGYGDAVQFLRFLPELRRKADRIVLEVAPRFVELARRMQGADEVITWGEAAPAVQPEWDVQIEINEILPMLRLGVDKLPYREKYVQLLPEDLTSCPVHPASAHALKVGVVWASGQWNLTRSLTLGDITPILAVEGCEFWNLQGGSDRADWPKVDEKRFHIAAACEDSILGLTAIISQLDLIISSDTLAVHLAGALGVPCWALLQHAADWRWMHGRSDTPWYPSVKLFRCEKGEPWADLTIRVAEHLQRLASGERLPTVLSDTH